MLKKAVIGLVISVILAFVAAQMVRPDMTNPSVDAASAIDASASIPAEVRPIFKRACADCHSHETRYPWYSSITPVNFWLQDHIRDGRRHLNVSIGKGDVEEICEEVTREKMPLPSYTWGHPDAVLTAEEKKILCDWSASGEGAEGAERTERAEKEEREGH